MKIIEISEFTGKSPSDQKAKRGRVIGRHGLARQNIEKKTNSLISVQGKTVAIIAKTANIDDVIDAVEALLGGASHESTLHYLEQKGKERFEL